MNSVLGEPDYRFFVRDLAGLLIPVLQVWSKDLLEDKRITRIQRVVLEGRHHPDEIDFLCTPEISPALDHFGQQPASGAIDAALKTVSSIQFAAEPIKVIGPGGTPGHLIGDGVFWINALWPCALSPMGAGIAVSLRLTWDGTRLKIAANNGPQDSFIAVLGDANDWKIDWLGGAPSLAAWIDRPIPLPPSGDGLWTLDAVPFLSSLKTTDSTWNLRGSFNSKGALVMRTKTQSGDAIAGARGGLTSILWAEMDTWPHSVTLASEALGLRPTQSYRAEFAGREEPPLFIGGEDRFPEPTGELIGGVHVIRHQPRPGRSLVAMKVPGAGNGDMLSAERLWPDFISHPSIVGLRGLDARASLSALPAALPYAATGATGPTRRNWFLSQYQLSNFLSTDDVLEGWWLRVPVVDDALDVGAGVSLVPPPARLTSLAEDRIARAPNRGLLDFPELRTVTGSGLSQDVDVAPCDTDPLYPTRLRSLEGARGFAIEPCDAAGAAHFAALARLVREEGAAAAPDRLLIGSLLLELHSGRSAVGRDALPAIPLETDGHLKRTGQISGWIERPGDGFDPVARFAVDLEFGIKRVMPAGQDPAFRELSRDQALPADQPLIVPLLDDIFSHVVMALGITEEATPDRSHKVSIMLRSLSGDPGATAGTIDAALVDPAPFSVARVIADVSTPDGSVLGELEVGPELGLVWRLASSDNDEMAMILPPQVTGETMIKGNITRRSDDGTTRVPVPDPDNMPFDSKTSTATRLVLDRSIQPRARTIAPWNLRRMLGFADSDAPGLGLSVAESELLYGLGYLWTPSGVRLAEFDGWAGRLADTAIPTLNRTTAQIEATGYADAVAAWRRAVRRRAASYIPYRKLRAIEDETGRRGLEGFTEDIRHRFRKTRRTADPFDLNRAAVDTRQGLPSPLEGAERPLPGGVDYLFEAEPVYDEVLETPDSVSSQISAIQYGPFGGDGAQEAVFANGKTIISSVTEGGYTRQVKLERIGRISMLWHLAKHVIVYERTVKTPRRFRSDSGAWDQPDDFEGFAVMRKVREYVEILEPVRRYPDFGEAPRTTGALLQVRFVSKKIDVHSDWGFNTETGWAIPLAGPIPPGRERFYPRPEIVVGLARAEERGGGLVEQHCLTPERLLFFTSVLRQDGADTNRWQAVPEVDFPVLPRPRAPSMSDREFPVDGLAENPDGMLPDPPPVEPGLDRFSLGLQRVEEPVNVTHGRAGSGIEARIESISVARARPGAGTTQSRFAEDVARSERSVGDALSRLAKHARTAEAGALGRLPPREEIQNDARRAASALGRYREALSRRPASERDPWEDFWKAQSNLTARWRARLEQVATELVEDFKTEIRTVVRKAATSGDVDLEAVRTRFGARAEGAFLRLRAEILSFEGVVEQVERELRVGIERVAERLQGRFAGLAREILALLGEIETVADRADLEVLFARLRQRLLPAIRGARANLREDLAEAPRRLLGPLSGIFSDLTSIIGPPSENTTDPTSDVGPLQELAQMIDRALGAIEEALEEELPGQDTLERIRIEAEALVDDLAGEARRMVEAIVAAIFDTGAGEARFGEILRQLRMRRLRIANQLDGQLVELLGFFKDFETLDEMARAILDPGGFEQALRNIYRTDVPDLLDLDNKLKGWAETARTTLDGLKTDFDGLVDSFEVAKHRLEKLIGDLRQLPLGQLIDRLRDIDQAIEATRETWRPINDLARETLRGDFLKGNPAQVASRTLALVQAWGDAPIAEALDVTRERLAYYLDPLKEAIDSTPAGALVRRLGDDIGNALGLRQPFESIADRFIPNFGDSFDFGKMLPDFAGLKLTDLLPGLNVPGRTPDWLSIKHGFDRKALMGWAEAKIDVDIAGSPRLFDIGPVAVALLRPVFDGFTRIEVDAGGTRTETRSVLKTDLQLIVGPQALVTFRDAALRYEQGGALRFDIDPSKLELAPAMQFISDLMQSLVGDDSGVTFAVLPEGGFSARLDLPIPALSGGVFSITNLSLHSRLDLLFLRRFEIRTAFWLSRPERPFNISILFLGGGGWVGVETRYAPRRDLAVSVEIGIAAGATAALNLGVASGIVQFLVSLSARFVSNQSGGRQGPQITIALIIWGELRILGIVSLYLGLGFSVTYDASNGSLTGRGWLSVRIKICWCIKINIEQSITVRLAGNAGGSSGSLSAAAARGRDDNTEEERAAVDREFETVAY